MLLGTVIHIPRKEATANVPPCRPPEFRLSAAQTKSAIDIVSQPQIGTPIVIRGGSRWNYFSVFDSLFKDILLADSPTEFTALTKPCNWGLARITMLDAEVTLPRNGMNVLIEPPLSVVCFIGFACGLLCERERSNSRPQNLPKIMLINLQKGGSSCCIRLL